MNYQEDVTKLVSEKLHEFFVEHPERHRDITFVVGPELEHIQFSKLVVEATCKELKLLIHRLESENWGVSPSHHGEEDLMLEHGEDHGQVEVGDQGQDQGQGHAIEGDDPMQVPDEMRGMSLNCKDHIILPDLDPTAFRLFLQTLLLDNVTAQTFDMNVLEMDTVINTIIICDRFRMPVVQNALETIVCQSIFYNFPGYIREHLYDFVRLSKTSLAFLLSSDELQADEPFIFENLIKWAEHQCKEKFTRRSLKRIQDCIGDLVFQIRFPIMDIPELMGNSHIRDVLDPKDFKLIHQFLLHQEEETSSFDALTFGLRFCTTYRCKSKFFTQFPVFSIVPLSHARFDRPFIFGEELTSRTTVFKVNCAIQVWGVAFLGPIDDNTCYNVRVELSRVDTRNSHRICGAIHARARARKNKLFYLRFDETLILEPMSSESMMDLEGDRYELEYCLQGPRLAGTTHSQGMVSSQVNDVLFIGSRSDGPLAQILFSKCEF